MSSRSSWINLSCLKPGLRMSRWKFWNPITVCLFAHFFHSKTLWRYVFWNLPTLSLISYFLVRDSLYNHPCVSVCVCVLRFQNSQRNLYWGQPGARYWSAEQYKQLTRCTQITQGCSAWPQPQICIRVPDSCPIYCACLVYFF